MINKKSTYAVDSSHGKLIVTMVLLQMPYQAISISDKLVLTTFLSPNNYFSYILSITQIMRDNWFLLIIHRKDLFDKAAWVC